MSAAQDFPPLSAVPSLGMTTTSWRLALLLRARRAAERAHDAARAVPAAAATFIRKLLAHEQMRPAAAWGRALVARARGLARPLTDRVGGEGVVAAVGLLLTSKTAQQLARDGSRLVLNLSQVTVRTAEGLLRRSGATGARVADRFTSWGQAVRKTASDCAAPALRFVARTTVATEGPRSVVGGFIRSYLAHRLLRLFVRQRLLRAFLSAVVLPALADGSLLRRLQQVLARVVWRIAKLRARAERVASSAQDAQSPAAEAIEDPNENEAALLQEPSGIETGPEPAEVVEEPQPGNRAERRAAQQQAARNRRKPNAA